MSSEPGAKLDLGATEMGVLFDEVCLASRHPSESVPSEPAFCVPYTHVQNQKIKNISPPKKNTHVQNTNILKYQVQFHKSLKRRVPSLRIFVLQAVSSLLCFQLCWAASCAASGGLQ